MQLLPVTGMASCNTCTDRQSATWVTDECECVPVVQLRQPCAEQPGCRCAGTTEAGLDLRQGSCPCLEPADAPNPGPDLLSPWNEIMPHKLVDSVWAELQQDATAGCIHKATSRMGMSCTPSGSSVSAATCPAILTPACFPSPSWHLPVPVPLATLRVSFESSLCQLDVDCGSLVDHSLRQAPLPQMHARLSHIITHCILRPFPKPSTHRICHRQWRPWLCHRVCL